MRRHGLGPALLALIALGALCLAAAAAFAAPARPAIDAVGAVGVTVGDLERSVAFYRDVLSFKVVAEDEATGAPLEQLEGVFGAHVKSARLELGGAAIVLTQYLAPRGRPIPADTHSNDRSFQHLAIVVADMDRAYAHLRAHGVHYVSTEPQTLPRWNEGAAGIKAFYFADPDDHTLEVIWFPAGKGDPRWQRPTITHGDPERVPNPPRDGLRRAEPGSAHADALFLGIDHTAIGVGDTARSLRFYRDTLGMRVAGESENYGTEQEHLNNVFGAHLRITGLRAASGPGIELLEYLAPRDGRPAPADLRANDLAHWQTVLRASDVGSASARALAAGGAAVSSTVVERDDAEFRIKRARLIRDPDGHGLLVAQ
jgi:catechol 2,3-dioxygenase-like lactoylglutathione lyase family enzyme